MTGSGTGPMSGTLSSFFCGSGISGGVGFGISLICLTRKTAPAKTGAVFAS
jgi:hypothetical protein